MNMRRSFLIPIALFQFITPSEAGQCELFDVASDSLIQRKCSVDYEGDAVTIRIGKKKIVFVETGRQGQWATGMLDGRPAARYEIDRSTFSYATLDLKLFLDQSGE